MSHLSSTIIRVTIKDHKIIKGDDVMQIMLDTFSKCFVWNISDDGTMSVPVKVYSEFHQGPVEGKVGNMTIKSVDHIKVTVPPKLHSLPSAGSTNQFITHKHDLRDGRHLEYTRFDASPYINYMTSGPWVTVGVTYSSGYDYFNETIQTSNGYIRKKYGWDFNNERYYYKGKETCEFDTNHIKWTSNPENIEIRYKRTIERNGQPDEEDSGSETFYVASHHIPFEYDSELIVMSKVKDVFRHATAVGEKDSVSDLYNQNVEKILDHLDANSTNNIESIGDFFNLIGMIKNPGKSVQSLKKMSGKLRNLMKDKQQTFIKKAYKTYADLDMTYKWSIEPVPEDIKNTLDGIAEFFQSGEWDRDEKECFASTGNLSLDYKAEKISLTSKVTTTLYHEPIRPKLLESLGLDITCSQVWEALPLSFIVDMLFSIKDYFKTTEYADKAMSISKHIDGICNTVKITAQVPMGEYYVNASYFTRHFEESLDYTGSVIRNNMKCGLAAKTLFDIFL